MHSGCQIDTNGCRYKYILLLKIKINLTSEDSSHRHVCRRLGDRFQALALDDGDVYQERLQVALRRLQLRAQLYELPERAEDQAAMMVEQVIGGSTVRSSNPQ